MLHLGEGNALQVFPLLLILLSTGLKLFSSPCNLMSSHSFHCRQHPETHSFLRTIWSQLAACFCQLHRPGTDSGIEEQEVRFPCPWQAPLILKQIEGLGTGKKVPGSLNIIKSDGGWAFGLFCHVWPPLPLSSVYCGGRVWKDPRTSCGSGCNQHCSLWG